MSLTAGKQLLLSSPAGVYQVSRSLRFNSADSAYLSRTPGSAGNRRTWTWSGWVKTCTTKSSEHYMFSAAGSGQFFIFGISNNDEFFINPAAGAGGASFVSSNLFRDRSAWYHFVVSFDSTQATSTNRLKVYVNGTALTWSTASYPAQNTEWHVNNNVDHRIGSSTNGTGYIDQYLADIYLLDGTATTPSTFAETDAVTGQWVPKTPTGITYGTNGFKLNFSDNSNNTASTLGKDTSGNGNNWTPNNLSVTAGAGNDSLVDTPTSYGTDTGAGGEVRGNYCTWNPLTGAITLTNGNLAGNSTGGAWRGATGTAGVLSGKWYWESTIQNTDSGNYYGEFGFIKTTDITGAITNPSGMNGIVYYARNGRKISGGTSVVTSSSGATTGDIVQVAVDLDAGKIWFGVNNTWIDSGNPASGANAAYTGLSGTYLPAIGVFDGGTCNTNFGQRAFAYTAPSGFSPLVDTLLPTPTIAKPNTVMDIALWTGNGSARSITGFNFSPDLVWIKSRSAAYNHRLLDTVRGATEELYSSTTDAETTQTQSLTAFNSDGFSLGTLAQVNESSTTFVGWAWDAGSSAAATNNSGSIQSTVKVNATSGFSIATFTSPSSGNFTVGHGLGVAPTFVIVKTRGATSDWSVYHASATTATDKYLVLNSTAAVGTYSTVWGAALPTSSVVGLTSGGAVATSQTCVMYSWTPIVGYSSFGSYTGNGSTDGPFVYTGFRPAFLLLKVSSTTGNWIMMDSKVNSYNAVSATLRPNLSLEEQTGTFADFTSNGFTLRTNSPGLNGSGSTYVYYAVAESPFQYARAR